MTSGRVAMVAFDAMDPDLTRRLAADGRLPAFQALFETAARRPVRNPPGLFVGSLWSTFFTGQLPVETGFHCWEEIEAGGYARRITTAAEIRGEPFWAKLSAGGKRVAVIDVPHSRAGEALNGLQVSEWGCHDRHFGFRTYPPELAAEIAERVGLHPVLGADAYSEREWAPDDYVFREGPLRTAGEEALLLDGLLRGVDGKRRLCLEVLADGPWDLFLTVFGETHSVGHQSWHLHDSAHPRYDPAARAQIGDPLIQVYEKMDQALADISAQLGEDTLLLVLLSHGMGPHYDGTHLLPEILRRLDGAYRSPPARSLEGRLLGRLWTALPSPVRRMVGPLLARVLGIRARRTEFPPPPEYETEEQRRSQLFFMSPNNFVVGGVRANLKGREADGCVEGGRELDELFDRLREDLLALVNVDTGAPVINAVERSDCHYAREPVDALPDLFLDWNHDRPIETVWSPCFGLIQGRYAHWRTGDHRPGGLLLLHGPGVPAEAELPPLVNDRLGAFIADQLGSVDVGAGAGVPDAAA